MKPPHRSPLDLDHEEQQARLAELRARFDHNTGRLWLTPDGLKLWLDASVETHPLSRLDASSRTEAERLHAHGLLTEDGDVPENARPAVEAVRNALCTFDIEAAVGPAPRHFRAWIGHECAVLFRSDPPWAGVEPTAEAMASHQTPPGQRRELRIVPRDWPPVAAARWVMLTPRRVFEPLTLTVPAELFHRRLVDHTTPPPDDAHPRLVEIWNEPMFTWGLTVSPTTDTVLVLDAGNAGHRQVVADGEQVVLHALPSLALWNGIVDMLERALN
ncbi:hypothetical protein EF847_06250 [Actinobacteria bacterium YIM 96077]|uniref:ESX secretion-associated protein EspG n=1 Tax=Phytoactinopolyspora halophila TaxID=1981511 RepID=A0A329QAH0_9ACTN|nr:hypothetical protein [Phytoactinopolyspora halophila]AYY12366.1 hypothetical protein EF847_06250 [Actinobacteria bacterium YIM 96077]RAW09217.1 hypothetical protein DPM12_22255 [Phytoactinopolyspora halophila]